MTTIPSRPAAQAGALADRLWLADRIASLAEHVSVGQNEQRLAALVHHALPEILAALRTPAPAVAPQSEVEAADVAEAVRWARTAADFRDWFNATEAAHLRLLASLATREGDGAAAMRLLCKACTVVDNPDDDSIVAFFDDVKDRDAALEAWTKIARETRPPPVVPREGER